VPGLEASVAWGRFDFYVEAEYVRDSSERTDSYFYAWSELGFRPVEWLRVGLSGQLPALGYTVPYAIGNILLTAWGPVIVALMAIGR
jgi:hypothetical protein